MQNAKVNGSEDSTYHIENGPRHRLPSFQQSLAEHIFGSPDVIFAKAKYANEGINR